VAEGDKLGGEGGESGFPPWRTKYYLENGLRRERMGKESFYHGVMAVLDVIYSFDQDPTAKLPISIIRTLDAKELLEVARSDEYHNLDLLKKSIAETPK